MLLLLMAAGRRHDNIVFVEVRRTEGQQGAADAAPSGAPSLRRSFRKSRNLEAALSTFETGLLSGKWPELYP